MISYRKLLTASVVLGLINACIVLSLDLTERQNMFLIFALSVLCVPFGMYISFEPTPKKCKVKKRALLRQSGQEAEALSLLTDTEREQMTDFERQLFLAMYKDQISKGWKPPAKV